MQWEQRDSNPRHSACKADAAAAELCSRFLCLGIEPSIQVRCPPVLTNRLPEEKVMSAHHQRKTLSAIFTALEGSEDMIESDISNPINSCCWARTSDIRINSPAQLPTVLSRNVLLLRTYKFINRLCLIKNIL